MKHFHHIDARSLEEASEWLKDGQGKAKAIASGTDLLGGRIICHRKGSGPCHAIQGLS